MRDASSRAETIDVRVRFNHRPYTVKLIRRTLLATVGQGQISLIIGLFTTVMKKTLPDVAKQDFTGIKLSNPREKRESKNKLL